MPQTLADARRVPVRRALIFRPVRFRDGRGHAVRLMIKVFAAARSPKRVDGKVGSTLAVRVTAPHKQRVIAHGPGGLGVAVISLGMPSLAGFI